MKRATEMTDAEYAEALRAKGWRAAPNPTRACAGDEKHPRDMTDIEFETACKARKWRQAT